MRLFILAIVAGVGVLVGIALYVGQEIVNPGTPDSKITARLAEQQEAIAVTEKSVASENGAAVESESDPSINAYKSQLRTAQYPAGTSSFDSTQLRKQLPDIFQFPEQNTQPQAPIAIATTFAPAAKNAALPAPAAGTNGVVPDAPTGSDTPGDIRSDSPMIKQLAAPEHKPSVLTATNPNVQVEVAPAVEGRAARTRMIVTK